jgi:hypothetical protein
VAASWGSRISQKKNSALKVDDDDEHMLSLLYTSKGSFFFGMHGYQLPIA